MRHRAWTAAVAAVLPMIFVGEAAQPAPDESAAPIDEVVVVANRDAEPLSRIGNSVTVLDTETIHASQAVMVADLLEQTPGISMARAGGVGGVTSVYVRGAESDQTVVVIDGVQLNDPSSPGGGLNFANLLVGDIGRIEILRGAQSTLYGSQAMGGVINIITADPAQGLAAGLTAEGGSHNTGYGSVNVGDKSDTWLWRLAGYYYGTSGIADVDQQFGGRRLCASQIGGGSGQVRYDVTPDLQVDLRGFYTTARTDFDGYDTPSTGFTQFGDDHEYGTQHQVLGIAGLTWNSPDRSSRHRIELQYTDSVSRNYDPNAPTDGYGVSASTETFYGIGRNLREDYQGTWRLSAATHLVFGAQHERSTIDTDSPAFELTPQPLARKATIDSGYAQVQSEVLDGLTLTAGERYDHHDVYGGHDTGELAAAWALDDRHTLLRASVGQGFKAPTLYQLYSSYGNLTLQPELATSWDAGIERHMADERLVLSATYFERSSRNLINFFPCPAPNPLCITEPFGFYANIARAVASGVELQASARPTERLSLSANYTLTDTENRSPGAPTYGQELPNRPKEVANATATYRWPAELSTALAVRYAGRSLDESITPVSLGGYVLVDLRAAYPLTDRFEIYGRVENITDKRYEVLYEYRTLGRVGYVGVRVRM